MKLNKSKAFRRRKQSALIIRNIATFVFIFASAVALYFYLSSYSVQLFFPIKNVVFIGNRHLTDDELLELSRIHENEELITLSNKQISERLLKSPWIRGVNVRKEFPDTLTVTVEEAKPFALLDMKRHLFLLDEEGKLLEEFREDSIPFLPVIAGDPFKNKEGFSEALKLVKSMNERGFSFNREYVEIFAQKPNELTVTIDGTAVKIGEGEYEEKLDRFIQVENDIKKLGIPVDYIDLRFANRAILKPIPEKVDK